MKTTSIIVKSVVAAILLTGSAILLPAQTTTPTCPLGNEPGYCQTLTPEQRAVYRAAMQQYVTELRQKQADGTLTAEEQAWLKQVEQRGGRYLTGTPRGPGAGKGQGKGVGQGQRDGVCDGTGPRAVGGARAGQGQGKGLCDGTGPRALDGVCPLGNTPQRKGVK